MLRREYPLAEIHETDDMCEWVQEILAHIDGSHPHLDLPVDIRATAFQLNVWQALRTIPYGETRHLWRNRRPTATESRPRRRRSGQCQPPVDGHPLPPRRAHRWRSHHLLFAQWGRSSPAACCASTNAKSLIGHPSTERSGSQFAVCQRDAARSPRLRIVLPSPSSRSRWRVTAEGDR
ncbi:MAG: hypothetical protein U0703_12090 [Anaerolineae bacterium]